MLDFNFEPETPAGPYIRVQRSLSFFLHFLKRQGQALINAVYAPILTQICSHKEIISKRPYKCACF